MVAVPVSFNNYCLMLTGQQFATKTLLQLKINKTHRESEFEITWAGKSFYILEEIPSRMLSTYMQKSFIKINLCKAKRLIVSSCIPQLRVSY